MTTETETNHQEFMSRLEVRLSDLHQASHTYSQLVEEQQALSNELDVALEELWKFITDDLTLSGQCLCNSTVTHVEPQTKAELDEDKLVLLTQKLRDSLTFHADKLIGKVMDETVSGVHFMFHINQQFGNSVNSISTENAYGLLDVLFDALQRIDSASASSNHSATIIKSAILFIGSKLSGGIESANEQLSSPELIDLRTSRERNTISFEYISNEHPAEENQFQNYLFQQLIKLTDCSWARMLIKPTLADLKEKDWIKHVLEVCSIHNNNICLLEQICWDEFIKHSSSEEIRSQLLNPIKSALECYTSDNVVKAIHTLCKILIIVANARADLSVDCVQMLLRSGWPTKMIASISLCFFPWNNFSKDELLLVFSEVYHLFRFGKEPQKYESLSETNKNIHRANYVNYLITNQAILTDIYRIGDSSLDCELLHSTLPQEVKECSRFPQLIVLRIILVQLLTKSSDETLYSLVRLFLDDLVCFAFLVSEETIKSLAEVDSIESKWIERLKQESTALIAQLCVDFPWLPGTLIFLLGTYLPLLKEEQVVAIISPALLQNWVLDEHSLNWLAYFLSLRAPPPPHLQKKDDSKAFISTIFSKSYVQLPSEVQKIAPIMGVRIFESTNWKTVTPICKMKAIIVLLASIPYVDVDWFYEALLREDLMDNFDYSFITKILKIKHDLVLSRDELIFAQSLMAIKLVEAKYKSKASQLLAVETQSTRGEDAGWMKSWGIYNRLLIAAQKIPPIPMAKLLVRAAELAITAQSYGPLEAENYKSGFREFLLQLIPNDSLSDSVYRAMVQTSTQNPETTTTFVTFWTEIFSPSVDELNDTTLKLYNRYVNCLYVNRISLQPIVDHFSTKKYSVNDSTYLLIARFTWVSYAITLSIPKEAMTSLTTEGRISNMPHLEGVGDIALNAQDVTVAVLFWQLFFSHYFELKRTHSDDTIFLTLAVKDTLTNRFLAIASEHETSDPVLSKIYYSFTSWDETTVFSDDRSVPLSDSLQISAILNTDKFVPRETWIKLMPCSSIQSKYEILKGMARNNSIENITSIYQLLSNQVIASERAKCIPNLSTQMVKLDNIISQLKNTDTDYILLLKQLHSNVSVPVTVNAQCSNPRCEGKVLSSVSLKCDYRKSDIEKGISANRASRAILLSSLKKNSRSLARFLVTIEQMIPNSEKSFRIQLFYGILALVLQEYQMPLFGLQQLAMILFKLSKSVLEEKDEQERLMHVILTHPARNKEENNDRYSLLKDLFNPITVLDDTLTSFKTYLQLLLTFVQDSASLSYCEIETICTQFKFGLFIQKIKELTERNIVTKDELQEFANKLNQLLTNALSAKEKAIFIQPIVTFSFLFANYNKDLQFSLAVEWLHTSVSSSIDNWQAYWSNAIREEKLSESSVYLLTDAIKKEISGVANSNVLCVSSLLEIFSGLITSRNFSHQIGDDSLKLLESNAILTESRLWTLIQGVITFISDTCTDSFMTQTLLINQMLSSIVTYCPEAIHGAFVVSLKTTSFLLSCSSEGTGFPQLTEIFNKICYDKVGFHKISSLMIQCYINQLREMLAKKGVSTDVASLLFASLPWNALKEKVLENSELAVDFLILYINVLMKCPQLIPDTLASSISSSNPTKQLLEWQQIDLAAFKKIDGTILKNSIVSGCVDEPYRQILEALTVLRQIVNQRSDYSLTESRLPIVLEIESIIFTYFSSKQESNKHNCWFLPFKEHMSLIISFLLPLITAGNKNAEVCRKATQVITQCFKLKKKWKNIQIASELKCNSTKLPTDCSDYKSFKDNYKMLILSCIKDSVSLQTCGYILSEADQILMEGRLTRPKILLSLFEEATRTYLRTCDKAEPLNNAAKQLKVANPNSLIDVCKEWSSPLTMLLLLQQQYDFAASLSSVEWMKFAVNWVELITEFKPSTPQKELDIIALWFFILVLVRDVRWLYEVGNEKMSAFQKQLHALGNWRKTKQESPYSARFQLAARAIYVFIAKLLLECAKKRDKTTFKAQEKQFSESYENLKASQGDETFEQFNSFFDDAQHYQEPEFNLTKFEGSLLKTVVPVCLPYMVKLICVIVDS